MSDETLAQARVIGHRSQSSASQESLIRHPEKTGTFKSDDGTEIFYAMEGQGPVLVFCYGLVCSSLHWTYQIEHFKKNYTCLWFDYRGHQRSQTPTDLNTLTLTQLATDLKLGLKHLDIESAVWFGHSMGVNVVLEVAHLYPEIVKGMVLTNGTPFRPLETLLHTNLLAPAFDKLEYLTQKTPKLAQFLWKSQKGNPLVHRMVGMLGFNLFLTPIADVARYVDQLADIDPKVFLHLIRSYNQYDGASWYHKIQIPTLVVTGVKDRVVPIRQQRLLAQLIPSAKIFEIENGSHCSQMDFAQLFNQRTESFLSEIN